MTRDEEGFTDFVRARSAALLRTAYLLTGDAGLAEDLLQTALAKSYVALGRLRDPAALEPYVRRTLVTTACSWWRRRAWRSERPSATQPDVRVESRTDQVDDRDQLWAALRTLPARQRAVVVLRFYEDRSEAETARLLGCAPGTVKSQSARALASLRAQLSTQDEAVPDGKDAR